MKIGVFGGTFNPPHNTHIAIAQQALLQLQLDKLIVIPCGDPPHKHCDVDKYVRLHLCQLAFDNFATVSDYELTKQGKSYTVETLRYIREKYPNAEIYLVIGGDSLVNFGSWYCPNEIAQLATLVVANRSRKTSVATVRRLAKQFGVKVQFLDMQPNGISSTDIRLKYQFGESCADAVAPAVDDYVTKHRLYAEYRPMVDKLRAYLTPQRFSHTFYVVKRGLEICDDSEKDKVFIACLLHDCAKYVNKQYYAQYGFTQSADMPDSVVHSFLGVQVAKRDFGVTDQEILDAIAYHTTGRPAMTRLDKIVYVADKTEQTRTYPLSHLKKGSLDDMFIACLKEAYEVCLERHCDSVCPLSEQTLAYYCQ